MPHRKAPCTEEAGQLAAVEEPLRAAVFSSDVCPMNTVEGSVFSLRLRRTMAGVMGRALCCMLVTVLASSTLCKAQSEQSNGECITYKKELTSKPDLKNRVVIASSPLPPGYVITDMTLDATRQRSFYWCELKLPEGDTVKTYRHFGHNTTHLWVEKGCGAWFTITACIPPDTNSNSNSEASNMVQATMPVTTTTTTTEAPREPRKELQLSDLRQGALLSLMSWLSDKGQSLEDRLGGGYNTRVARSVDEEFELEFGQAARQEW